MKDRIPTKPGRVAVYDEDGNFLRYEIHVRADEPTQEGDPLNKENLLADLTCDVLNIPRTSVPDDVFLNLALGTYKYVYVVTAKTNTGRILSGITIKGIVNRFGQPAVTDSNGVVVGFSDSPFVTLTFTSGFIDLKSKTKRVTNKGVLTQVNFIIEAILENSILNITTSKTIGFSKPVIADFALVGGGAGGASSGGQDRMGPGGGGGYVTNLFGKTINNDININIGSGGAGGIGDRVIGSAGGTTRININGSSYSARGGQPGTFGSYQYEPNYAGSGNGDGGANNNDDGGDRTQYPFNNSSIPCSGGGGAGGYYDDDPGGSGGSSYGGSGGSRKQDGRHARSFGGGGGGAGRQGSIAEGPKKGGDGYQGVVMIRWRYL